MNHRFGAAGEFTVGLEEELLLVDPETLQLDHGAERVLNGIGLAEPRAGHEAFQASIEVRSEPRGSASRRPIRACTAASGEGIATCTCSAHSGVRLISPRISPSTRR